MQGHDEREAVARINPTRSAALEQPSKQRNFLSQKQSRIEGLNLRSSKRPHLTWLRLLKGRKGGIRMTRLRFEKGIGSRVFEICTGCDIENGLTDGGLENHESEDVQDGRNKVYELVLVLVRRTIAVSIAVLARVFLYQRFSTALQRVQDERKGSNDMEYGVIFQSSQLFLCSHGSHVDMEQ